MDGIELLLAPAPRDGIDGMDEGIDGIDAPPDAPPCEPEEPCELLFPPPPLLPLGMLELLPLDPDEPLEPLDPEEPPLLGVLGMELGEGMLGDICCSAQPPIRKLETVPTAVIWVATINSRRNAGLVFIARLSRRESAGSPVPRWPPPHRAAAQLNGR
jgi:hypothetical protein